MGLGPLRQPADRTERRAADGIEAAIRPRGDQPGGKCELIWDTTLRVV